MRWVWTDGLRAVLDHSKAAGDRGVLMTLVSMMRDEGRSGDYLLTGLSLQQLADECQVGKSTFIEATKRLSILGELGIEHGGSPSGGKRAHNTYRLLLPVAGPVTKPGQVQIPPETGPGAGQQPVQDLEHPIKGEKKKETGEGPGADAPAPSGLAAGPKVDPERKHRTLSTWLAYVNAKGERAIPETDAVWAIGERAGLDLEMVKVAWHHFKSIYTEDRTTKTYIDWRATFRNSVRANWFRLWAVDGSNRVTWTSLGLQARNAWSSANTLPPTPVAHHAPTPDPTPSGVTGVRSAAQIRADFDALRRRLRGAAAA